jgi:hypothetical protein
MRLIQLMVAGPSSRLAPQDLQRALNTPDNVCAVAVAVAFLSHRLFCLRLVDTLS